jgi:hypothetical protein
VRVIVGKASASKTHEKYPEGEIHAVLMFIKSNNHDNAQKIAAIEMHARDWGKIKISKVGTLNPEKFNADKEPIKQAFWSASENGFGVVIYGNAEEEL